MIAGIAAKADNFYKNQVVHRSCTISSISLNLRLERFHIRHVCSDLKALTWPRFRFVGLVSLGGGGGGGRVMILIGQFFALGSPGCNLKSTGKAFHLSI